MLSRLGVTNTALCFTGGATGAECSAWLREKRFTFHAFASGTATRSGTVVRDLSDTHHETTFLGPDVVPAANALLESARFLEARPDGEVLAFCGSFPGWNTAASAPLRTALQRWNQRGLLLVDTYGPPLADLAALPLHLLKINADELRTLAGSPSQAFPTAAQRVVITDGPRAIAVRDIDGGSQTFVPPAIHEVSPTGSGDVLLACVIEALFVRKVSLKSAIAFAIPYAAANAAHPECGQHAHSQTLA
jgi:fructose-1-phosphate kinase PfkB-like protein